MKRLHKTSHILSPVLTLCFLALCFFIGAYVQTYSFAQQKNIPIIKKQPSSQSKVKRFFDTQRKPQVSEEEAFSAENQKALDALSQHFQGPKQKSGFDAIANNITNTLVNPFKGNQAVVDALKSVIRYHTGGGDHPIGIKINI